MSDKKKKNEGAAVWDSSELYLKGSLELLFYLFQGNQ